jgi:hypothetical protein
MCLIRQLKSVLTGLFSGPPRHKFKSKAEQGSFKQSEGSPLSEADAERERERMALEAEGSYRGIQRASSGGRLSHHEAE